MASNEKILEEAKYYLENEVTMKDAAEHFGISKKAFQVHMKKLDGINSTTYKLVQDKKLNNLMAGTVKGGQNGKPSYVPSNTPRKHSITDEEIENLANRIIKSGISLRELERETGIPKSTILDNLTEENLDNYEEVRSELEGHKPQNRKK